MERKFNYNLIFLLILSIAIAVISTSLKNIQFMSGVDEGYYLRYAHFIGENGILGFRELFKEYINNQSNWLFPNPLRVGFIILSAVWLKILGYSFLNLAFLSLFSYAALLILSYYYSKKYLGNRIALLFIVLLAFSPLNMALSRRALLDSTANLFSIASIWMLWDFLQGKSKAKLILFIVIFSLSILVKETGVLFCPIFIAYLAFNNYKRRENDYYRDLLFISIVPLTIVGLVYFLLGCIPFIPLVSKIVITSPGANPYAINYGAGPWYRYLIDYMLLSPAVIILALGFLIRSFLDKEDNRLVIYFIFISVLSFILFNTFTKNVRYVLFLDTPIRLFFLLALNKMLERLMPHNFKRILFLVVILIAFLDYLSFKDLFIDSRIYDPVSFSLLGARHIIPIH